MRARALWMAGVLGTALLTLTGCRTDMWVQQKVKAQDNSEFYALADPVKGFDGKIYGDGSRPMPPNTIPSKVTGMKYGQLIRSRPPTFSG